MSDLKIMATSKSFKVSRTTVTINEYTGEIEFKPFGYCNSVENPSILPPSTSSTSIQSKYCSSSSHQPNLDHSHAPMKYSSKIPIKNDNFIPYHDKIDHELDEKPGMHSTFRADFVPSKQLGAPSFEQAFLHKHSGELYASPPAYFDSEQQPSLIEHDGEGINPDTIDIYPFMEGERIDKAESRSCPKIEGEMTNSYNPSEFRDASSGFVPCFAIRPRESSYFSPLDSGFEHPLPFSDDPTLQTTSDLQDHHSLVEDEYYVSKQEEQECFDDECYCLEQEDAIQDGFQIQSEEMDYDSNPGISQNFRDRRSPFQCTFAMKKHCDIESSQFIEQERTPPPF
ncbi:hypothetical protein ADUPG1_013942 [Aduncisulcus paluster]|uniref:Uncharacterized protein n=1 Tax=Aduncisulcus paluster TaxID=2918883 RepID=A0ABQ5K4X8_9EUKA|nr:hypothetical protein ADUPG1_013942 [Aduncisulcus paluster]